MSLCMKCHISFHTLLHKADKNCGQDFCFWQTNLPIVTIKNWTNTWGNCLQMLKTGSTGLLFLERRKREEFHNCNSSICNCSTGRTIQVQNSKRQIDWAKQTLQIKALNGWNLHGKVLEKANYTEKEFSTFLFVLEVTVGHFYSINIYSAIILNVKPTLASWHKSHIIMRYYLCAGLNSIY